MTPPALYAVSAVKTSSTTWDFKLNVVKTDSGIRANGGTLYLTSPITSQTGGANFSALAENQRAGLALYPGSGKVSLYVGFGSHCDSTPYQGYVAGFQFTYGNPSTWTNLGVFNSQNATGGSEGGIWMSGGAPAIDGNGNVYVSTGNGDWNGTPGSSSVPTELAQSVVQLKQSGSSLTAVDYYTPNDYSFLNSGSGSNTVCLQYKSGSSCPSGSSVTLSRADYDLASGGVTLMKPAGSGYTSLCGTGSELIAGGKEGVLYGVCYDPSASSTFMGGLDSCGYNPTSTCLGNLSTIAAATACIQASSPTPGSIAQCFNGESNPNGLDWGLRSTAAFWAGNSGIPEGYLYVVGVKDVLKAYTLNSNGLFGITAATDSNPTTFSYPGATPSVSWNNTLGSSGLVWAVDTSAFGTYMSGTSTAAGAAVMYGYAAIPVSGTLTNEVVSTKLPLLQGMNNHGPGAVKYAVPTIAGGLVFVGGGEANPAYYNPGPAGSGTNCTPSAGGGSCLGALYIYGLN